MEIQEFVSRSHLDVATLNAFIEEEWLAPLGAEACFSSPTPISRAQLIRDLEVDFGVNHEGIAIILHLLDQLHGLRCLVRDIHAMEVSGRTKGGT